MLLEVPGRSGLAGRTAADVVARGLGRVQTSSRQPLPGLRPLGLSMEVGSVFLSSLDPLFSFGILWHVSEFLFWIHKILLNPESCNVSISLASNLDLDPL